MKFRQKPYFEPKTCKIQPKVLIWSCPDLKSPDLDMSGPEKEDKYLLQTIGNTFIFSDFTSTQFKPSEILLFFEILHLSIFYDKYLLQTIGNTFIFSDFTPFHFLLANLSFLSKIMCFISKFIIFYKIRNSVSGPPKIFLIGSTRGVMCPNKFKYQKYANTSNIQFF